MRLKLIALAVVCVAPVLGQFDGYTIVRESSKSGASEVVTIQLPAEDRSYVEIQDITVQCSAACPVVFERNGTAATTTAATLVPVNPQTAPAAGPRIEAFHSSNVGAGTAVSATWSLPAGAIVPFGMEGWFLTGTGNTNNVTVRVGPLTGDVKVQVTLRERR